MKNKIDKAIKKGESNESNIKLNEFLTSMFNKEEIELLLIRELKQAQSLMPERINQDIDNYLKEVKKWKILTKKLLKN